MEDFSEAYIAAKDVDIDEATAVGQMIKNATVGKLANAVKNSSLGQAYAKAKKQADKINSTNGKQVKKNKAAADKFYNDAAKQIVKLFSKYSGEIEAINKAAAKKKPQKPAANEGAKQQ